MQKIFIESLLGARSCAELWGSSEHVVLFRLPESLVMLLLRGLGASQFLRPLDEVVLA